MRGKTRSSAREDVGKIKRCIVGTQFDKQVKGFGQDLLGPGIGAVDFVDDNDRLETDFEGLLQHKAGLRTGTFKSVNQHQASIGHLQHSFDFAAKVGVAGCIDNVDFRAQIVERDIFGENRNTTFPFQVVGIENTVLLYLGLAELTTGFDQAIDECRLAVVNVGDDSNVANVRPSGVHSDSLSGLPRGKRTLGNWKLLV